MKRDELGIDEGTSLHAAQHVGCSRATHTAAAGPQGIQDSDVRDRAAFRPRRVSA